MTKPVSPELAAAIAEAVRFSPDMRVPNHGDPADPAERAFDPKEIIHRTGLLKARAEAAARAEIAYKEANPTAASLKVRDASTVYKPSPEGFYRVPPAIVAKLLEGDWLGRTQQEVLDAISLTFPDLVLPKNIWAYRQKAWAAEELRKIIRRAKEPFRSADLAGCTTLSEFRRALRAAASTWGGAKEFTAKVVVSEDTVTINGLVCKIVTRRANGREYPYIQPTVKNLLAALEPKRSRRK